MTCILSRVNAGHSYHQPINIVTPEKHRPRAGCTGGGGCQSQSTHPPGPRGAGGWRPGHPRSRTSSMPHWCSSLAPGARAAGGAAAASARTTLLAMQAKCRSTDRPTDPAAEPTRNSKHGHERSRPRQLVAAQFPAIYWPAHGLWDRAAHTGQHPGRDGRLRIAARRACWVPGRAVPPGAYCHLLPNTPVPFSYTRLRSRSLLG